MVFVTVKGMGLKVSLISRDSDHVQSLRSNLNQAQERHDLGNGK